MRGKLFKELRAIFTVSLVVMVVSAPMVMALPVHASGNWMSDETITVGNTDVEVWEQAIMPLRTDTSNADTKIDNAAWYVSHPDFADTDTLLNKSTLGVFNTDDTITVHYTGDDTTSPGNLKNENIHFVVARLEPDTDTPTPNIESVGGALDLLKTKADQDLSQTDLEDRVNGNVTFVHEDDAKLKNTANHKFEFEPEKSGEYVFFVAKGEMDSSGLTIEDSELTIGEDPTIIGVEHAMVHDQPSSVELVNEHPPARGSTLEFDVDDELEGDNVEHGILVYDEETGYQNQTFKLDVSGDPATVAELVSQTTFKHSIDEIYGVSNIEDGTTVFGNELPDRDGPASLSMTELMELIAENTDQDPSDEDFPDHKSIDSPADGTLDASVTVVSGNPEKPIEVETLTDWAASPYRWIHVAVNEEGEIRTNSSTFELERAWFGVDQDAKLNRTEITAGQSITATGTVTNYGNTEQTMSLDLDIRPEGGDWSKLTQSGNITLAGNESTSFSITGTISDPGTYDVRVHGRIVDTVTVAKADDGDETDDDDDDRRGGGGGGGGGGATGPPPVSVETSQQSDGSVLADIRSGQAGSTVSVSIPSQQATRVNGVTFKAVDVDLQNDNSHFSLTINSQATRPSSVSSDPDDAAVKGYLEVTKQLISNADISQATVKFRLSPSQLSEYSSPENVVLYRYHDGAWQELETTFVGEQNGEYAFSAVTPGFSVFAVGEKQPDMSIPSTTLQQSSLMVGDTVQVTAEVTNDGTGQGIYPVELTVDGEVVETKEVTVSAGDTTSVTFSYSPSEAGSYDIALNDVSAGTLEVSQEEQPDDTTDQPDDTTEQPPTSTTSEPEGPSDDDGGIGGSLIAMLVLLVLGGAGGGLYYFRDEVEEYLEPYLNQ